MLIALTDDSARVHFAELEEEPEPRFTVTHAGFVYHYERRGELQDGTRRYYLTDAETDDGT